MLAESTNLFRIEKLITRLDESKSEQVFLDLACGSGLVCSYLTKKKFPHVYGCDKIEVDPKENSKWSFFKIDFQQINWNQKVKQQIPKKIGCITAFDIVEHLHNPVDFLMQIKALMDHDTDFFLTTPNTQSWERFLFPNTWSGASDPEHFILYNMYSLKFLLKKCGFKVIHLEAPIQKLGILNSFIPKLGGQFFVHLKLS